MSFVKRLSRSALIAPFLVATARAITPNSDMTYQHVGFSDITFTPVPEINPAWSAVGSCLLAAVLILRHSAKFRK